MTEQIIREICKAPTPRLKALKKHNMRHIMCVIVKIKKKNKRKYKLSSTVSKS